MKSKSNSFGTGPLAMILSFLRIYPVFPVTVVTLVLAAAALEVWAINLIEVIPFDRARIIIEFNSSGNEGVGDVGVQVLLDGESWMLLRIRKPEGGNILKIMGNGSLQKQGLTELFFESSEPSLDEFPLEEFLARFPEGEYEFQGITIDGFRLTGGATLTHVIPAGPVIVSPDAYAVVDPDNLVIEWEPVTGKIAGSGELEIVAYQVIVERTDNDLLGVALRTFDIKLPTTSDPVQSVTVPPQFLEPGTEYKFEVLAIETGGNQTITEGGPFVTQ